MKMRINPKKLSLQEKMSCVFILANMLVFLVTLLLFTGINSMFREIDMVYEDNMHLNELSDALTAVQDSMTDYLNAKTSDSLEEFYRNEQTYTEMVEGLNDKIAGTAFLRMERSIRHMSREYLDVVGQTPKLLERAGCSDKGSITGLYTVLVDGDDFNEPITDTARSILDGHIMLDRKLAHKNH